MCEILGLSLQDFLFCIQIINGLHYRHIVIHSDSLQILYLQCDLELCFQDEMEVCIILGFSLQDFLGFKSKC